MNWFSGFANWRSGALATLARFPWNIFCGATGAAALIVANHWSSDESVVGQSSRLAMTTAVGMPLFFSFRMIRESVARWRRWPIEIVGLLLVAGWFLLQPARPFDAPGIIWIRWLLFLAALHFFAAVSANLWRLESLGFWEFNRRLFLRFCLATLYTGVLTAGLELALLSADRLFELKISRMYGDLFFVMIGFFHPAFFLAGVPRNLPALETDNEYPRGLKAFTQFALAPLVAVYTAILYAYAIKIIVVRSWPHGWVALPLLLLSGIGILAFLLLYPLRTRPEEKWAVWFTRNFPRAMAPLSILLFLSVHVRVREYGVTEERYLGIVAAIWILTWSFSFLVSKNSGIRWIPSSLAAICLLAAFGPWSAGAVSKASQLSRVKRILQDHDLWAQDRAVVSVDWVRIPAKDFENLHHMLEYLLQEHGGDSVKKLFAAALPAAEWNKLHAWTGPDAIMGALKLSIDYRTNNQHSAVNPVTSLNLHFFRKSSALNVEGFRQVCRVRVYAGGDWRPERCGNISIGFDEDVLKTATDDDPSTEAIPIQDFIQQLPMTSDNAMPDEKMRIDFRHRSHGLRIVFISASISIREGLHLYDADFYLLEK